MNDEECNIQHVAGCKKHEIKYIPRFSEMRTGSAHMGTKLLVDLESLDGLLHQNLHPLDQHVVIMPF